ncbi:Coenzyme PQQ synthesis protein B [plant metagenome]|uniref:Coenzyme PQQ synthesis protein B n=1 Tax=plant metagenome TaxID=1297885 RepID=A0A484SHZ3_9ZZZZ
MQVLVLGAGAGGGFPQWNCNTPRSRAAREGHPALKPRTQASIAVSADGERWLLVNASPDFRQQQLAAPVLWPREGLRDSPIKAVTLTGGELDHITGLLSMRERQPFNLYATPAVLDLLARNPVFDALHPGAVQRSAIELDAPFRPHDPTGRPLGLTVRPYTVPGKVPLFMEAGAGDDLRGSADTTVGLHIAEDGGGAGLHFIPGCAAIDDALRARLDGADLLLFDGTLWRDDEMQLAGVGEKTGARMGHISVTHLGDPDAPGGLLHALAGVAIGRRLLIHVNTTNPVLDERSAERALLRERGWDVAEDGMTLHA